ncbi:placenta-specific gene 8 protein-like [Trachinotus anak]|uniref:placenta-specific gene 8 protein-like n=1 Tax=Trachinotus anak TaxID=443729 RepID=UPI0039F1818A
MATNVFINNQPPPQPQPPAVVSIQSNQWSTGICDCFDDVHVCCCGFWCFPCFACKTTYDFGEFCCLPLLDNLGMTCPQPISMSMRVAVRNRYGIQGDMTSDCVHTTFCTICSWCQMAREIKRRKTTLNVLQALPTNLPGVVTSQPMISAFH